MLIDEKITINSKYVVRYLLTKIEVGIVNKLSQKP